jgi:exopolyphosphatase/pppGpp-phosphohydrolase
MLSWDLKNNPPKPLDIAHLMRPIIFELVSVPRRWKPSIALATGGGAHHLLKISQSSTNILTSDVLNRTLHQLLKHPADKIAKKFDINPQRARTLVPAALILASILDAYGLNKMTVTPNGLREGMLNAYLLRGDRWWTT